MKPAAASILIALSLLTVTAGLLGASADTTTVTTITDYYMTAITSTTTSIRTALLNCTSWHPTTVVYTINSTVLYTSFSLVNANLTWTETFSANTTIYSTSTSTVAYTMQDPTTTYVLYGVLGVVAVAVVIFIYRSRTGNV